MSNYKKFTLDTIKQKLKNGDYEAPVGAMRAIGKTQELSEDEKEKARAMVRKHFGVEAPAPKAKKAAKKVAKKAAKKAAAAPVSKAVRKKAAKKSKRARAAAPEDDTSTTTATTTGTGTQSSATGSFADPPTKLSVAPVQRGNGGNVVLEMGQVISTVGEALKSMETAKRLFPKAKLERDVEAATGAMARAVKIIDREIMTPRLGDAPAASTPSPRKKGSKKGTRAKAATPTQTQSSEGSDSSALNGASEGHTDLTEEEEEQLRLARETQQVATG